MSSLYSLLDVFQNGRASVHHRLEGVLAARRHTLVRVQQNGEPPVGLVHLLPAEGQSSVSDSYVLAA